RLLPARWHVPPASWPSRIRLFLLLLLLFLLPPSHEASCSSGPPPDDPPLCVSDSNRMFTLESLKAVWHGQKLDFFKAAHVGAAAPNPEVIQLDGRTRLRILDYARGKRPLILNFGSCT
uniref:Iodothyronine deiodinase n=1 Tax=Podarcis muralis TaxID=64176 RepID=A0A670HUE0_PODMU